MSRRNLDVPLWEIPILEFISLTADELQELESWYRWSLETMRAELRQQSKRKPPK